MAPSLLQPHQRQKLDPTQDDVFYSVPRLVTHVDEGFISQLTDLYQQRLPAGGRILDLMSSWVSHLPKDVAFEWVEGHGMNEEELRKNPRLDHYFVQNLNANQHLPFPDQHFDAVLNTVSVQYLQYPEAVFTEVHRVLKPGGVAIVSFSNRMFYHKAIAAWRDATDAQRRVLVGQYFRTVPGFSPPEMIVQQPSTPILLQMLGMGAADPFYAVVAERQIDKPAVL
jgi:SAM-dependent methyltransferase